MQARASARWRESRSDGACVGAAGVECAEGNFRSAGAQREEPRVIGCGNVEISRGMRDFQRSGGNRRAISTGSDISTAGLSTRRCARSVRRGSRDGRIMDGQRSLRRRTRRRHGDRLRNVIAGDRSQRRTPGSRSSRDPIHRARCTRTVVGNGAGASGGVPKEGPRRTTSEFAVYASRPVFLRSSE